VSLSVLAIRACGMHGDRSRISLFYIAQRSLCAVYLLSRLFLVLADGFSCMSPLRITLSCLALVVFISPTVSAADRPTRPITFERDIEPLLARFGCNAGACHGKASGQNGFRLSLMGFEPKEDYEHLVNESRGRRLSPAAPEHSLLLLKGAALMPHGG
jgi:hypothetical protein